jgi:hypothetical protein
MSGIGGFSLSLMDSLPQEILNAIFIQLPIVQKQVCLFVCKKWASVIHSSSLFHTINIRYKKDTFEKFITLIKDQPLLGLQVSKLDVTGSIPQDYDERQLLCLFPNLKVLEADGDFKGDVSSEEVILAEKGPILEQVVHVAGFHLTKLILSFPSSCLVSLTLNFNYVDNTAEMNHGIFPLLKNAPLLNNLCILYYEINSHLLQVIHTNALALTSFTLYDCIPLTLDESISVVPITTLKSLVVDMGSFDDQQALQWLHYFNTTYPNLENFEIERLDILLEDRLDYRSGMFQRLTVLHLALEDEDEMDVYTPLFELLDKDTCQIKKLKLNGADTNSLHALTKSNQSKYINHLELLGATQTTGFEWLQGLTSLASVSLDYYTVRDQLPTSVSEKTVDLNELLQACPPTVDSVSVLKIKIKHNPNPNQQFPLIKCLRLLFSPVPLTDIDQFIAMCLPALDALWISLRMNTPDGIPNLSFPNHHFSTLHLFIRYPTPRYFKLVTSEKTRCFATSISGNDYSILGNMLSEVTVKGESMATVSCASTRTLYINETRVCF